MILYSSIYLQGVYGRYLQVIYSSLHGEAEGGSSHVLQTKVVLSFVDQDCTGDRSRDRDFHDQLSIAKMYRKKRD